MNWLQKFIMNNVSQKINKVTLLYNKVQYFYLLTNNYNKLYINNTPKHCKDYTVSPLWTQCEVYTKYTCLHTKINTFET